MKTEKSNYISVKKIPTPVQNNESTVIYLHIIIQNYLLYDYIICKVCKAPGNLRYTDEFRIL